jgi:hypothetical protein
MTCGSDGGGKAINGKMKYDPSLLHRRSLRLQKYDYSLPGAYFVTMVAKDRINLFGEIIGEMMKLSVYGEIVQRLWGQLPLR